MLAADGRMTRRTKFIQRVYLVSLYTSLIGQLSPHHKKQQSNHLSIIHPSNRPDRPQSQIHESRYRLDTVLRLLINLLGSVCGVYWSSKCTWSHSPLNSTNRPSHFSIRALNISSSLVSIGSVRTFRRYLVVNTK